MAFDAHANFAYSVVVTAPSPAASGTSLTVTSGTGALFPAVPFNATVWPSNAPPLADFSEIVRVTNIAGDVLTITRAQEGTAAVSIAVGYQIAASLTAKTITDIESAVNAALTNIKVSAGTLSTLRSDLSFANSNGVSFGLNTNGVITASAATAVTGSMNVSAGTTSGNLASLVFSNGNNVSFGLNGGTLTASIPNVLTTAMASDRGSNFVQATAAFHGTNISGTIGSNDISLSVNPSISTARASNDGIGLNTAASNVTWTVNSSGLSLDARGYAGTVTGATSASLTVNSNGISISLPPYITTARASTDALGLNTAQSNVTWTANSAGLTLDGRGYAGTGTTFNGTNVSGSVTLNSNGLNLALSANVGGGAGSLNVSAGTTSNNLTNVVFSNANAVSFGLTGSTLTASVPSYTTIGTATTVAPVGTANSVGTASRWAAEDHVHALTPSSFGVSNLGNTAGTSGVVSEFPARVLFAGGNNITLSQSVNGASATITISGPNVVGVQTGISGLSAGTTQMTSGTAVFSNANGVSFGVNGNTLTASVQSYTTIGTATTVLAVGTAAATVGTADRWAREDHVHAFQDVTESLFWRPNDNLTTVGAPINGTASVIYCPIDHNLSATRFDLIGSVNVATVANTSSAGVLYSITAALYTLNNGTLSSVSSITTNNQMTWGNNVTGGVTGAFFFSAPLTVNASADKYWVAVALSTRATGLTGTATTSLGNTITMMGVGSAVHGAFSVREPGAATANSNGWFYGMGLYSGTSNFATIGLSNLTQQGTNANRANVALRMVNV